MSKNSSSQSANALRILAADAVQQANCGHPGMPMGMAEIAEVLWRRHLIHNPSNPNWFNRDRFVLSNGHGSMLIYSLLHLSGYDLTIQDLKDFRQLHSKQLVTQSMESLQELKLLLGHWDRGYLMLLAWRWLRKF